MGSDDEWFEDYDTGMSDGEGGSPFNSDSDGEGSSSGGDDDDGFESPQRVASQARSDHRRRMYTIIDRQSLQRMQVGG